MTVTDAVRVMEVPAAEVQPFDGLHEGTYVTRVTFHDVEQRDPFTGTVTTRPAVTITSCAARTVVAFEHEGRHVHELSHEFADEKTYERDAIFRISRPAVIAPCPCENNHEARS